MRIFVIKGNRVVSFEQEIIESDFIFKKRVEFICKAIDMGKTVERSNTLGRVYRNKLQCYIKYPDELEQEIKDIMMS